jgi:hypothetical protein
MGSTMIKEWGYSAKIFIYHYRAILRGMIPFASPWDDRHEQEMRQECCLYNAAIEYVRRYRTYSRIQVGYRRKW